MKNIESLAEEVLNNYCESLPDWQDETRDAVLAAMKEMYQAGQQSQQEKEDFLREMELGIGSAVSIIDYIKIPETCQDPKSIYDCINNIYNAATALQNKLDEKAKNTTGETINA
jgi:hypothetical protein